MEEENKDLTPDLGNDPQEPVTPQVPNPEPQLDVETRLKQLEEENEKLKIRNSESSREAQLLIEQNKLKDERLNKLTNQEAPTDDELKQTYPNWDEMDYGTQTFLKNQAALEKKVAATSNILLDKLEEEKWQDDLARIKTKHPELADKESDFKAFAYKPSHKNIDVDTLAKAFLFDNKAEAVKPNPTPGAVLEQGSGGPKLPPAEISMEDVAVIRTADPKRYRELLMRGQI